MSSVEAPPVTTVLLRGTAFRRSQLTSVAFRRRIWLRWWGEGVRIFSRFRTFCGSDEENISSSGVIKHLRKPFSVLRFAFCVLRFEICVLRFSNLFAKLVAFGVWRSAGKRLCVQRERPRVPGESPESSEAKGKPFSFSVLHFAFCVLRFAFCVFRSSLRSRM